MLWGIGGAEWSQTRRETLFLYAELMQILGAPNEKNRALPPKYNIPYFSRFLIPGSIVAFERLK